MDQDQSGKVEVSKKIGIFAGTFDPIHMGHLAFAEAALKTGLEKVMFLVEPRPRRKQGVRALEHRIKMTQLAVADNPRFGTIVLEQARFTPHETLPVLQKRFAGYRLLLLFGDDVIVHIAHWPHIDAIVRETELLIATRHQDVPNLKMTLDTLQKTRNLRFNYNLLEAGYDQLASSTTRLNLKQGKAASGLPPAVADYIQQHGLYKSSEDSK